MSDESLDWRASAKPKAIKTLGPQKVVTVSKPPPSQQKIIPPSATHSLKPVVARSVWGNPNDAVPPPGGLSVGGGLPTIGAPLPTPMAPIVLAAPKAERTATEAISGGEHVWASSTPVVAGNAPEWTTVDKKKKSRKEERKGKEAVTVDAVLPKGMLFAPGAKIGAHIHTHIHTQHTHTRTHTHTNTNTHTHSHTQMITHTHTHTHTHIHTFINR
jgi:hypothetical protein